MLAFHTRKDKAVSLWEKLIRGSLLLGEKLLDELVVGVLEFLVHAGHDSDVIVIDQIYFFEVQHFRQLTSLVSEEKVTNGLSLEWQVGAKTDCI